MKELLYISVLFLGIFVLAACEEEFIPDYADEEPTVVFEGYVEAGDDALPAHLIISKTYPLFQTSDTPKLPEVYLGGGTVNVSDGEKTVELTEFCINDLDPALQELFLNLIGLDSINPQLDLCIYADILNELAPQEGGTYNLNVEFEGNTYTALTTIPRGVELDSLVFKENPNIPGYGSLNGFFQEPLGPDYYRLLVSVDSSEYDADFSSVTDDIFFDGLYFNFGINKPQSAYQGEVDQNIAGLFAVGDTVDLRWSTIDQEHFSFWNTLEFAQSNQGPFSSYSRATTNIEGGIGIWGGYNRRKYRIIIE